jgi:hypothetical protein
MQLWLPTSSFMKTMICESVAMFLFAFSCQFIYLRWHWIIYKGSVNYDRRKVFGICTYCEHFFIYALIKSISFEFLNHSILCGLVTFVD